MLTSWRQIFAPKRTQLLIAYIVFFLLILRKRRGNAMHVHGKLTQNSCPVCNNSIGKQEKSRDRNWCSDLKKDRKSEKFR